MNVGSNGPDGARPTKAGIAVPTPLIGRTPETSLRYTPGAFVLNSDMDQAPDVAVPPRSPVGVPGGNDREDGCGGRLRFT